MVMPSVILPYAEPPPSCKGKKRIETKTRICAVSTDNWTRDYGDLEDGIVLSHRIRCLWTLVICLKAF